MMLMILLVIFAMFSKTAGVYIVVVVTVIMQCNGNVM